MNPDFENYTIDELYDAYENIDSSRHPERAQRIRKLIENHEEKHEVSEQSDFEGACFKSVKTHLAIDNAIFTFGILETQGKEMFGYKLFCSGADTAVMECFMPVYGNELLPFVNALKNLPNNEFSNSLQFKISTWEGVSFHFKGLHKKKGIKIKTQLTGFFSGSSSFFSSYIKPIKLDTLVSNLERCL